MDSGVQTISPDSIYKGKQTVKGLGNEQHEGPYCQSVRVVSLLNLHRPGSYLVRLSSLSNPSAQRFSSRPPSQSAAMQGSFSPHTAKTPGAELPLHMSCYISQNTPQFFGYYTAFSLSDEIRRLHRIDENY